MSISYNNDNIKPYYRKALSLIKEQKCAAASIVLNELKKIYTAFGPDYDDRIFPSVGHLISKEVIALYSARELLR
jgi:hypothetical protein